jgi:hypothetical protein
MLDSFNIVTAQNLVNYIFNIIDGSGPSKLTFEELGRFGPGIAVT